MTTPNTPGSLAGHEHPFAWWEYCGKHNGFHLQLGDDGTHVFVSEDLFDDLAEKAVEYINAGRTLEARLEAAERVVGLARMYATAPASRLKDALAAYDALTHPATAAEQEAGE